MKRKFIYIVTMCLFACSCVNDDSYTMDDFRNTISIVYQGTSVQVSGDVKGLISVNGAHVTVNGSNNTTANLEITLSGSTTDGSLLVYNLRSYTLVLNGVNITNANGPAINNQCGKALYLICSNGTTNTLTDGATYAQAPTNSTGEVIDQKGTLFSEGQIFFRGTGQLTVNGNGKNGIASDDYIIIENGNINVNVSSTGSNGIKVNDGFTINAGTLNIDVSAKGARGIKNDAATTIAGGTTTIKTSGDCLIETNDGIADTTACAGIKSDSLFVMTAGTLDITSTGDGAKGINCSADIEVKGGRMTVTTTGTKDYSKPHGLKADGNVVFSGGEIYVCSARKAISTDSSFLINGGTVMAIGKKESEVSVNSTQNYSTYDDDDEIDAIGGESLSLDGVTYTIPSVFTCRDAFVIVSNSSM